MPKRILVPMDQSPVAEAVLPVVEDLARGGAVVRLLHVAPEPGNRLGPDGRVVAYTDQEMERLEAEGLDYLGTVEARLPGVHVERVVRFGDPLAEILREVEAFGADLIVVTTSSRSGLGRALLGSVAERVMRRAEPSVLLLRPALSSAA
jgi:nucleotide-binding universal stress UspA family protein